MQASGIKPSQRHTVQIRGDANADAHTPLHGVVMWMADKTRNTGEVMRFAGCTLEVAVGYVRTTDSERDRPSWMIRDTAVNQWGSGPTGPQ